MRHRYWLALLVLFVVLMTIPAVQALAAVQTAPATAPTSPQITTKTAPAPSGAIGTAQVAIRATAPEVAPYIGDTVAPYLEPAGTKATDYAGTIVVKRIYAGHFCDANFEGNTAKLAGTYAGTVYLVNEEHRASDGGTVAMKNDDYQGKAAATRTWIS